MARSRPAARRDPRRLGDGQVLPGCAQGPPAPGQAQRAPAPRVLLDARVRGARGRVGDRDLEARAARAADGAARRIRVGALLALCGDVRPRLAHAGTRLHGVRGRPLLFARDAHGRLRRLEITRGAERAALRESARAATDGSRCLVRGGAEPRPRAMSRLWLPRRHAAEHVGLDRRAFLEVGAAAALGAWAITTVGGCNSRGPESASGLLSAATRWNERVERALFRHDAMNVAPAGARAAGA